MILIFCTFSQAAAWCALNGVGLALVMPCVQSIIAEVYRANSRGKAFGLIFTASALGVHATLQMLYLSYMSEILMTQQEISNIRFKAPLIVSLGYVD